MTAWCGDAEGASRLDRRLAVGERFLRSAFCPVQAGSRSQVDGALLDVGGLLEPREHREDAARAVELAALDVDLDARLEQAQHDAAGVDLLLA